MNTIANVLRRRKGTLLAMVVVLTLVGGSTALAGTGVGGVFNLGKTNTVNAVSKLVGSVTGASLVIDNNSADPAATALNLQVKPGKAPMKVNSNTRVANLNAASAGRADSAASADNANTLDGKDSTDLLPGGTLPAGATIRGTFEIDGTTSEVSQLVGSDSISFVYKLSTPPNVKFVPLNTTPPAECPWTADSPQANPGFLCIYENNRSNMVTTYPAVYNVSRVGAGMYGRGAAEGVVYSGGTWAVTAPTPAQARSLSQEGSAATFQSRREQ